MRAATGVHRNQGCDFAAGFWFFTAISSSSVKFSPNFFSHGRKTRCGDEITIVAKGRFGTFQLLYCTFPSVGMGDPCSRSL